MGQSSGGSIRDGECGERTREAHKATLNWAGKGLQEIGMFWLGGNVNVRSPCNGFRRDDWQYAHLRCEESARNHA